MKETGAALSFLLAPSTRPAPSSTHYSELLLVY